MALGTTGISTSLVASTIGAGSNDVGTLCTHHNINKWSKWKPYRYNSLSGLTETIIKNINFGMTPATLIPSNIPGTESSEIPLYIWGQWQKPRGGQYNEFYRLGDFRNYNHSSEPFCTQIEFKNQNGGIRPVNGNSLYPSIHPIYTCRLYINPTSDIKLSDFYLEGINIGNLYLTLIISGNMGGINSTESLFVQSPNTVSEAINNGVFIMTAELDTYDLASKITINENIIFAYLAPKLIDTNSFNNTGVSLKIDSTFKTAIYNSTYATYGDGGDGGNPAILSAECMWLWYTMNPSININTQDNTGIFTFDMFKYEITHNTAQGYAALYIYISELNDYYMITIYDKINLNSTGQQIIDTTLVTLNIGSIIDPNTSLPYTSLTCKIYVSSITPSVATTSNEQDIVYKYSNGNYTIIP